MNKLCPRCRCSQPSLAAFCADCGHQFRTVAPMDQTQFAMGNQARRRTSPQRLAWGIPLIVLGLLFVTNPSRAEFLNWVKGRILAMIPQSGPGAGIPALATGMAAWWVDGITEEQNFLVGTLFTVHPQSGASFRVLGIAKQFVPLDSLPAILPEPAPVAPPAWIPPAPLKSVPAPLIFEPSPGINPPRRLPPGEYVGPLNAPQRVPALPSPGTGFGGGGNPRARLPANGYY